MTHLPEPRRRHRREPGGAARSMPRRDFLGSAGLAAASLLLPAGAKADLKRLKGPVRIGVIADLHQDVMHDGEQRMEAFVAAMTERRPDALLQLGDFAYPNEKNRAVIDSFNQAHPRRLHVIGNHDTDNGHTKQQCLDTWGMPGRYYAEDVKGLRFLVLDGNDRGSPTHGGGYPSYVGEEQVAWLEDQLGTHPGPLVLLSHQPLAGEAAVDNAEQLQALLGRHADKVVLAVNGHSHIDQFLRVKGVPYLHINSASYLWVGGKYKHDSYPAEVHAAHPWIGHTCPYRDALFTTLTFDPLAGTVQVAGKAGEWVGPSPEKLGYPVQPPLVHGQEVAPAIRKRTIRHQA